MNGIPFIKMHGLGNDFVILDGRREAIALGDAEARAIAERRTGVGCDQVILLEATEDGLADVFMHIRNADGCEAEACGNASRCVAFLLMKETGRDHTVIETAAGIIDAAAAADGAVAVDMGRGKFEWRDIPLREAADTLHLGIREGPLADGCAVNVGNPHVVFFVEDAGEVPLDEVGPRLERHRMFPERTNVGVAQVLAKDRLRLRVWERGAGITRACGSGACAALVAAHRRGLTSRRVEVVLDGGALSVEWLDDDHVLMTGPVAVSFTGVLDESLLSGGGAS